MSTSETQTASRPSAGPPTTFALLKGDGFMGGEVPPNQAAIDAACLAAARTDVVLSGTAGVTDLAAAAYALLLPRRTRVPGQGQP